MKIVGIIGKLNSGKDAVARVYIQQGYIRRAFADPVKEIVHELFGVPRDALWGDSEARTETIRNMLQGLGTDYARGINPNVWVNKMCDALDACHRAYQEYVVIPDVRFLNEAEMLYRRGATLIRVTRPANGSHTTEAINQHQSETQNALIPAELVTHTIVNDGSLADLHHKVKLITGGKNDTCTPG